MKFYSPIILIKLIFIFVFVILCASCSQQGGDGINIFRPERSRIDNYSTRTGKGSQKSDIAAMSRSIRDVNAERNDEILSGYLTAIIGFIALIAIAVIFERYLAYRMKMSVDSPSALFIEICAGHQLTRMERNLIEQVARDADINDPLPVFIEPKYLLNAISKRVFKDYQQTLEYLLAKLFESKSESSIIKRSSILLQSELDSDLKSGVKSGITDSTIAYGKSNISVKNSDNSSAAMDSSASSISMQTSVIIPQDKETE